MFKEAPSFEQAVAGLLAVAIVLAVIGGALVLGNKEALLALTLALAAATGWYFRGKVQAPGEGGK